MKPERLNFVIVLGTGIILMVAHTAISFKDKELPPRSSKWNEIRSAHLEKEPACVFCDSKLDLQVHHIEPFEFYPEKELDPKNLITLCGPGANNCHLRFGHLGSYRKRWNPR